MKNKINKVLSICLVALTLAISVVGVGATQSNSKGIISAKAGETVKANVYITENSGIVSLDFSVVFDENALTLKEITNTGLLTGAAYTPPQKDMDANAYHSPATPVWISTSTSNITTTGTLLALEFVVNADATEGEYPITIEGVVATDVNLAEPTSLVVTSDTIKVTSGEVEPTEPQPTEPQPTEPQPTEPQPTEPQPTEPTTESGTETTDSNNNNATTNGSSTNGTTQSGKVATGDNTPIFIIFGILLVSGLVIVVNKKRKLN